MVHPEHVLQGGPGQQGTRKASRIWPRAVRVPADISLAPVRVHPVLRGGSRPSSQQLLPNAAGDERGGGDKPAGKHSCFWVGRGWAEPAVEKRARDVIESRLGDGTLINYKS